MVITTVSYSSHVSMTGNTRHSTLEGDDPWQCRNGLQLPCPYLVYGSDPKAQPGGMRRKFQSDHFVHFQRVRIFGHTTYGAARRSPAFAVIGPSIPSVRQRLDMRPPRRHLECLVAAAIFA